MTYNFHIFIDTHRTCSFRGCQEKFAFPGNTPLPLVSPTVPIRNRRNCKNATPTPIGNILYTTLRKLYVAVKVVSVLSLSVFYVSVSNCSREQRRRYCAGLQLELTFGTDRLCTFTHIQSCCRKVSRCVGQVSPSGELTTLVKKLHFVFGCWRWR